jgi:hypothetical protein
MIGKVEENIIYDNQQVINIGLFIIGVIGAVRARAGLVANLQPN